MRLGKLAGLEIYVARSALIGSVVLWIVFSALGILLFRMDVLGGILGGFLAMLLHWLAATLHQIGHAIFAARTGYPMTGFQLWGVLERSLYPANEPTLPGSIHIRRALGGPRLSLYIAIPALFLTFSMFRGNYALWWVVALFLLDDLFVFALGSFLPLGFTDGSTLIRYWGKRKEK